MNALAVERKEKLDFVNKYMQTKGVPRRLQDTVRHDASRCITVFRRASCAGTRRAPRAWRRTTTSSR